jgi:hypothetical protein
MEGQQQDGDESEDGAAPDSHRTLAAPARDFTADARSANRIGVIDNM